MKNNNVNGINRPILAKRIYFSPCMNLNNIVNNATIRIETMAKREIEDTNT
jgi:hypothetical protein